EDGSLKGYRVYAVPITSLNRAAVADLKLSTREADRCKNFFALGLVYWLYERSLDPTLRWIKSKFAKNPAVLEANSRTLRAGYDYGETTEAMPVHYRVARAQIKPGRYRKITGNEALAFGLAAAAEVSRAPLLYASYPITPASDILHQLSEMKRFGVQTMQAEDEIAAIGVAVGAAFGGALGVTATSGPGICLKSEAIGLAVMTELPVVVIEVRHPAAPGGNGNGEAHFLPYKRDARLVRQWAVPGTPGLEHRIGGLEKEDVTGNVSYDPANHEHMVRTRAQTIANIANEIPPLEVDGPAEGDLLVAGWGGTYGALKTAVERARRKGRK